ncbi:MAG: methyltransferase domain-containing protein [Phycisphaerae bacterium]|nr:methyltransferase domain-containing protein [Phycisphaerae bacterium]
MLGPTTHCNPTPATESRTPLMREALRQIFACPECLGELEVRPDCLQCRICSRRWPRKERGVPVFSGDLSEQSQAAEEFQLGADGWRGRLRRLSTPPTLGLDLATSRCLRRLDQELDRMASLRPVLNVGSGARLTDSMRQLRRQILDRTVHLDVTSRFELVDLVADAGRPWPVKSNSLDAVIASAVLYYLDAPQTFAEQARRTVAPGGWLFLTVPMLQPQMEDFDCSRWTSEGLRRLFHGFEIVEHGPTAGPATVLGRTMTEFLAIVTSLPNRRLWGPARSLWGWCFWPVKYLDVLLLRHPRSHILASAVYLLARRTL